MPNRNELAKIHIAKKELGLDEETYRGVLWDRYHKDSAAELTASQVADLLDLFRQKGWRPASFGQHGLVHVLWRHRPPRRRVPARLHRTRHRQE